MRALTQHVAGLAKKTSAAAPKPNAGPKGEQNGDKSSLHQKTALQDNIKYHEKGLKECSKVEED
eukprot:1180492-Pyramimonas_sp.AAC.1